MYALYLRSSGAVSNRKLGARLATSSYRAFSSSSSCFEETKSGAAPGESERPKGVPLAFNLSGISIGKPAPRITVAERVKARRAEMAKAKEAAAQGDSSNPKPAGPPGTLSQRKPGYVPRTQDGRAGGPGKPPFQNGQRSATQGGQRGPSQNGQRRPSQGGQRAGGQGQGQGQDDQANAPMRKAPIRQKKKPVSVNSFRQNRTDDEELNDYAEHKFASPARRYDEKGLLKLKGTHEQLNPAVLPTLPKFANLSISSSFSAALSTKKTPAAPTLRIVPYVDRAPPKSANDPVNNSLGVFDNAKLALSRVRELEMSNRRDALGIVERMTKNPVVTGK